MNGIIKNLPHKCLGRWQPFHDGHYTLFKEIIKKTGQVCIQIRDVQGVEDNPFRL